MKNSKRFETLLLQRTSGITKLNKTVSQEQLYLREKEFEPLLQSLKEIDKQHKKIDKKIIEIINVLMEIENILEELKI